MAADRGRNRLWVAETFGCGLPGQSAPDRTGLLEVELSSGRIVARHTVAADGRKHMLGDVALLPDGSVYASDSSGGALYRLRPGQDRPEAILDTRLRSPQGLATSRDGKTLLIADYSTGLHRLDLATGKLSAIAAPRGQDLRGIDGLARYGSSLIATQNGAAPNRILRLHLSPDEGAIAAVGVLASAAPLAEDLTLGTISGSRYLFVARSQWAAFGPDGRMSSRPLPAMLAAIALGTR